MRGFEKNEIDERVSNLYSYCLSSIRTVMLDSASAVPHTFGLGGNNRQTLVLENNGLISVAKGTAKLVFVDGTLMKLW